MTREDFNNAVAKHEKLWRESHFFNFSIQCIFNGADPVDIIAKASEIIQEQQKAMEEMANKNPQAPISIDLSHLKKEEIQELLNNFKK